MAFGSDTGGAAFPSQDPIREGMTLRDWFAGQALCSIPTRKWGHIGNDLEIIKKWAECAYAVADAMIAERSKP